MNGSDIIAVCENCSQHISKYANITSTVLITSAKHKFITRIVEQALTREHGCSMMCKIYDLFLKWVNFIVYRSAIKMGLLTKNHLSSGSYTLMDVNCPKCAYNLGWKYVIILKL